LAWTELIDHNSELTVGGVLDSELNKNMSKNSEKMGEKYSRVEVTCLVIFGK
jgi:hypothetical protein